MNYILVPLTNADKYGQQNGESAFVVYNESMSFN